MVLKMITVSCWCCGRSPGLISFSVSMILTHGLEMALAMRCQFTSWDGAVRRAGKRWPVGKHAEYDEFTYNQNVSVVLEHIQSGEGILPRC